MLGCQSNKVVLFNNHEDIQIDDFSDRQRQTERETDREREREREREIGLMNSRKCEL